MLRLDVFTLSQICNSACDFKYPNKDLLYVAHAYPEFVVPTVTIRWEELAGIVV
jgi:hypothetical protein